jgi:ABC-type branched-subunit amino acid transport system ATPase component
MTLPQTEPNGSHRLEIHGVSKNFAGLRALDDVSLALEQGEILGLIGPNGSGKSTLINVITGLLPATSGKIQVNGVDITNKPPYQVAHYGLSRTFQTIRLFHDLTVLENVIVAAISVGFPRKEAHQRALQALEEMGLTDWQDAMAGVLPYGHERRVEVARALAMRPHFLLLD